MSILHWRVKVLFETRLKKTLPDSLAVAKHRYIHDHMQLQDTKFFNESLLHGLSHQGSESVRVSFKQPLINPSENIGGLPEMFKLPTVLSRAKHSCSFLPHTPSFPPHSTGTVFQTSVWCDTDGTIEAWATVFLILFILLVYSYGPFQPSPLFNQYLFYLLLLALFHYCCVTCPLFLKYIP